MILLNPKKHDREYLDDRSREIMRKTIAFFENKGRGKIKRDDHERTWYSDFLEFQEKEGLFATLLTPALYADGDLDTRWDTYRNCEFNEILAFYGLGYWYTWQVSILGLGPIWMSPNEEVKERTAQLLREGGIFAFGLSEKEHGADLYSTEMALTPQADGTYRANGRKYYIGNANEAALVSTFGKMTDSEDFVFFVVGSKHGKYECVKNVCNSQNFVAEYALNDYPITEADILSKGRNAWDTALNTVNVGKFNLGWASIGICTHAFYESIDHAYNRILYSKRVTEFAQVRQLFSDAYCRLVAMKLFALRASDYMRAGCAEDRRYLLYNPIVKMKVTTQGEDVINHLWDVISRGRERRLPLQPGAHQRAGAGPVPRLQLGLQQRGHPQRPPLQGTDRGFQGVPGAGHAHERAGDGPGLSPHAGRAIYTGSLRAAHPREPEDLRCGGRGDRPDLRRFRAGLLQVRAPALLQDEQHEPADGALSRDDPETGGGPGALRASDRKTHLLAQRRVHDERLTPGRTFPAQPSHTERPARRILRSILWSAAKSLARTSLTPTHRNGS
jgi:alkylation response protein AidB-like acyl-CoA dehydrogenase